MLYIAWYVVSRSASIDCWDLSRLFVKIPGFITEVVSYCSHLSVSTRLFDHRDRTHTNLPKACSYWHCSWSMHHQIHSGQGEIAKSSEDDIELGRIAITPRVSAAPPSFAQSQLHTIIQRQVPRPKEGGGFKSSKDTSRFPNTPNSFEFAGWGSLEYIELTEDELRSSVDSLARSDGRVLGQWKASGVAGNDVLGSVFYGSSQHRTVPFRKVWLMHYVEHYLRWWLQQAFSKLESIRTA